MIVGGLLVVGCWILIRASRRFDLRREEQIVCRLSVTEPGADAVEAAREILRRPLDWDRLTAFSVREGVAAGVYANLRRDPLAGLVPPDRLRRFRGYYVSNAARNLHHFATLGEILAAAERKGIRIGVLKGPQVAVEAYGDPALRPMGDLDLLVRPEDLAGAAAILAEGGFVAVEPLPAVPPGTTQGRNSVLFMRDGGGGGGVVHLHWHVANAAFHLPFYAGVGPDRLWEEMAPWSFRGRAAFAPSSRFLPAFLAEHALKHSFTPLIHLSDLVQVLRRTSPDDASQAAAPFGLGPALAMSRRVARAVLGSDETVPAGLALYRAWERSADLSRRSRWAKAEARRAEADRPRALVQGADLIARLAVAGWRRPGLCHVAYLFLLGGPALRLRHVGRLWFPDPGEMARLRGISVDDVTPGHYLGRLARGAGWAVRFMVPGL